MIWLMSDLHLGHANIIRYCDRPFSSAEEMDATLIRNWQMTVNPSDIIYIIGDVSFHSTEKTAEILKTLPGWKVLILGNHDERKTVTAWKKAGFAEVVDRFQLETRLGLIELQHHPYWGGESTTYPILFHGHSHNQWKAKKIALNGRCMLNFSVECWEYKPVDLETALQTVERIEQAYTLHQKTTFKIGEI